MSTSGMAVSRCPMSCPRFPGTSRSGVAWDVIVDGVREKKKFWTLWRGSYRYTRPRQFFVERLSPSEVVVGVEACGIGCKEPEEGMEPRKDIKDAVARARWTERSV